MKIHKPIQIRKWLYPISWLYGFGVFLRNKAFDFGIFKRKVYPIPVICVGNIAAGGTGKTPHTEYIVNLLKDDFRVAVLSRGYRRKTSGFVLADANSTPRQIGDESYQIKTKFPEVLVAVDANRRRGIETLLKLPEKPDVIIMDDGFQHRYVKPSYVVILSDYNRPIYQDKLLPAGRLRESMIYLNDANDIIITKCPNDLVPIDFRLIQHEINPYAFQGLFFTDFQYKKVTNIFDYSKKISLDDLPFYSVLLVTGIASPKPLLDTLVNLGVEVREINYKDHHDFSANDLEHVMNHFNTIPNEKKIILFTEKDAGKIKLILKEENTIKKNLFYIPIEVNFLNPEDKEQFDKKILNHVRKNTANG